MIKKNSGIDAYILKSQDFAQPILIHMRKLVHIACPDAEEKLKWSFPHFDYKGQMMCAMAAFKHHCSIGFWKASLLKKKFPVLFNTGEDGMGHFGKITSLKDLPSDKIILSIIKEAMKLNDGGIKVKTKPKATEKKALKIPDYFVKALSKNKKAKATFNAFSYTNKKEYVEWLTEAKTEDTRNKRLTTAIEWIAEGKIRNWKYLKK